MLSDAAKSLAASGVAVAIFALLWRSFGTVYERRGQHGAVAEVPGRWVRGIWWWSPLLLLVLGGLDPAATAASDVLLLASVVVWLSWARFWPRPTGEAATDPVLRTLRVDWGVCFVALWVVALLETYSIVDSWSWESGLRTAVYGVALSVFLAYGPVSRRADESPGLGRWDHVRISVGYGACVVIVAPIYGGNVWPLAIITVVCLTVFVSCVESVRRKAVCHRTRELGLSLGLRRADAAG